MISAALVLPAIICLQQVGHLPGHVFPGLALLLDFYISFGEQDDGGFGLNSMAALEGGEFLSWSGPVP